MNLLPKFIFPGTQPAIYDVESKTAIQQTGKLYQAMQDLITEYNKFADDVNSDLEAHKTEMNKDMEVYATALRQEFQDFIDVVDLKIQEVQQAVSKGDEATIEALTKDIESLRSELTSSINSLASRVSTNEGTISAIRNGYITVNFASALKGTDDRPYYQKDTTNKGIALYDDIISLANDIEGLRNYVDEQIGEALEGEY